MPHSISTVSASDPVRSQDFPRPKQAKARLASDYVGPKLGSVVWEALVTHYGSVKSAAISLGDVDPSLLRREVLDAKFARIEEKGDDETKAAIADAMARAYGTADPKARVARVIRETRQKLDELAELIS